MEEISGRERSLILVMWRTSELNRFVTLATAGDLAAFAKWLSVLEEDIIV